MSEENEKQLKRTKELFHFLQGVMPEGTIVKRSHRPKLTPEQAWTVIWYLGNAYWQVPDYIERCEICGDLYHTWEEGNCLDYGKSPYHFCGNCMEGEEYDRKRKSRLNPENKKTRMPIAKG